MAALFIPSAAAYRRQWVGWGATMSVSCREDKVTLPRGEAPRQFPEQSHPARGCSPQQPFQAQLLRRCRHNQPSWGHALLPTPATPQSFTQKITPPCRFSALIRASQQTTVKINGVAPSEMRVYHWTQQGAAAMGLCSILNGCS